ncbi:KilA-N domain-containing protein [Klebsiella pneumoniae]|uniref:KilA-N domain-containing protein n=1 Tax=Klebsiella pneumoniae TaxID=573 RepID=UPI001D0D8244|nr:KilA-N domain-containing protein [Klebsiella pneumoniae]
MKYPTVSVNGVSVRVDGDGRYNFNDLHAAAVAKGRQLSRRGPVNSSAALRLKDSSKHCSPKPKSALEQIQPLKVVKGGDEHGVWGVELLAIRYAAWIKPSSKSRCMRYFGRLFVWALEQCPA